MYDYSLMETGLTLITTGTELETGLTLITTGMELDPALRLDLDGPPDPAGTGLTTALLTRLPTGDGEKQTNIFPNTFNSGTDPDLGPPPKDGGLGTGMGSGDGLGIGCPADNSNFLYLGSLEMHALSSQLSDSSSGEGTGLTRSSARALEGQEVPSVQVESRGVAEAEARLVDCVPGMGLSCPRSEGVFQPGGQTLGVGSRASVSSSFSHALPAKYSMPPGVGEPDGETPGKQSDRKGGGLTGRYGENRLGGLGAWDRTLATRLEWEFQPGVASGHTHGEGVGGVNPPQPPPLLPAPASILLPRYPNDGSSILRKTCEGRPVHSSLPLNPQQVAGRMFSSALDPGREGGVVRVEEEGGDCPQLHLLGLRHPTPPPPPPNF